MTLLAKTLETNYKILDKTSKLVQFVPNTAQVYYLQHAKKKNVIIKPRQKGLSKLLIAKAVDKCLTSQINAVLVSHEGDATKRLFKSAKLTLENMILGIKTNTDSANMLSFDNGSNYFIGTAGQKAFGRGDTLHYAHLSEASYYPNIDIILNGVEEALGDQGELDIETTPNGRDKVYKIYKDAKEGKNSYNPIFIAWFIDQEYTYDNLTGEEIEKLSGLAQEQAKLTEEEIVATLTEDEKALIKKAWEIYGCEVTAGMIKWRRVKIADRGKYFFQEYPEDDVTCFITNTGSVFKDITVDSSLKIPYEDLATYKKADFRDPYEWEAYILKIREKVLYAGVDCAEGTPDGDNHSFAIYDPKGKTTEEGFKGAFVYEYTSNEPIDVFWLKIKKVIDKLPNLRIAIEKNGVGVAHVKEAQKLSLIFDKWVTDGSNRPILINDLESAYRNKEVIETYTEAQDEALAMIWVNDRADHPKDGHDDRVMARAIALQLATKPQPRLS
jgi:hypothetical protein